MKIIRNTQGFFKAAPRDLTKEAALEMIGHPAFCRLTLKKQNIVREIAHKLDACTVSDAFALNVIRDGLIFSDARAVA